jgi:hypothetical protein
MAAVGTEPVARKTGEPLALRTVLLVCGVLSSLLYVGIDLLAAVRYREYHSFVSQTISELSARGAPTKQFVDPLYVLYDVLTIAFGVGVWRSAGGKSALRMAGVFLVAIGVVGLPGPWLFPMHVRGSADVSSDVPHIVATSVIVLLIVAMIMSGAFALGPRFRRYSFATVVASLVFGALASIEAVRIAAGEPTPWIGLTERASIGGFLLWVAVLAIILLRDPDIRR